MRKTLSEPAYLVLASLVDSPKHGYAIVKAVAELSAGTVAVPIATVYFTVDRLALNGLIAQTGEEIVDGRARRIFAITEAGLSQVEAETARMAASAAEVRKRLSAAAIKVPKTAKLPKSTQAKLPRPVQP
jgi:PadR family transcriptional regulator, regulatory protein PadR